MKALKALLALIIALPLVTVAATGERIIALAGDVTEIIYALGAQSALVARDSTSQWPPEVTVLPDVGYLRQLNAEGILAMRPGLVLVSGQAQPSLTLRQLEQSGVNVITIPDNNDLRTIDEKVRIIALATGHPAEGESLRATLRKTIAALPTTALNKRVLFILDHSGMNTMTAGQHTATDAAIRAAGLQNAMQGFSRYQPLTREGVIASRPDVVVIPKEGLAVIGGEEALWALPGLAQTPAGQHKQVLAVDDMALLGFSVRTPQAILQLRAKAESLP